MTGAQHILPLPHAVDAVVIGGSAGSIEALSVLLPGLPANFALPIAVVVHLPPDRRSMLVDVFAHRCALPVREAEDKERVQRGVVYFAPPDYHLLFEDRASFSLSVDEPVNFSRPSIDVLFESAAVAFGPRVLGLLLSGSNADGAEGLRLIEGAGGVIAVQDPASALAKEMPQSALSATKARYCLEPRQLARLLAGAGGTAP